MARSAEDPDIWTGTVPYTDALTYFVQAMDGAGNVGVEANKAWYFGIDSMAPASQATSPHETDSSPITITWTASDDFSGVASVDLWYKFGANGDWVDSGSRFLNEDSGIFYFSPPRGNGMYYFATQATDWAGNREDAPTGAGDTWCQYGEYHQVYLPVVLRNMPHASFASISMSHQ